MTTLGLVVLYVIAISFIGLVVFLVSKGSIRNGNNTYDERQIVARGKAYKYAFIVTLIYVGVNAIIESYLGHEWCDPLYNLLITILLGVGTFAAVCIWKDAYVAIGDSERRTYVCLAIIVASNLVTGILNRMEEEIIIRNNKIENLQVNLICAAALGAILIVHIVKKIRDRRNGD